MSRWINALYDTRAEAEVAQARLTSEVGIKQVKILSKADEHELASLNLSDADRQSYSDGIRHGASLLIASSSGDEDDARVIQILKDAAARKGEQASEARAPSASSRTPERVVEEQRIPIVEEELRIGKREVVRGGANVQTHVREVPAEEAVLLKRERFEVDRRPVNRALSETDVQSQGVLKPRVLQISEMREEAVITKEAFIREEVVIQKTTEERVETVHDTVRRTEVEIDEYRTGDEGRR
jgi:uncharacterized protein (TIGR02271 family)